MKKPYLIAEILLKRGMPDSVVKEITAMNEYEIFFLKRKCASLHNSISKA
ncbi:hypothetical protein V7068_01435 [Bacillus sp. JJ634]